MSDCTPGQMPYGMYWDTLETYRTTADILTRLTAAINQNPDIVLVEAPVVASEDSTNVVMRYFYKEAGYDEVLIAEEYAFVTCTGGYVEPEGLGVETSFLAIVLIVCALFFAGVLGYRQGAAS